MTVSPHRMAQSIWSAPAPIRLALGCRRAARRRRPLPLMVRGEDANEGRPTFRLPQFPGSRFLCPGFQGARGRCLIRRHPASDPTISGSLVRIAAAAHSSFSAAATGAAPPVEYSWFPSSRARSIRLSILWERGCSVADVEPRTAAHAVAGVVLAALDGGPSVVADSNACARHFDDHALS
jgi:hypothetical protein